MTVQDIVTRVRATIDELEENASQFFANSTDEANLTRSIVDKIEYAIQYVLENAPLYMLDESVFTKTVLRPETDPDQHVVSPDGLLVDFSFDNDTGVLILPSDVLRIVEARLSSWSHFPIPVTDTSQVAMMQNNKYSRGSWDMPVNVLTTNENGKRELRMYSRKDNNDSFVFVYIKKPSDSYSTDNMATPINVPPRLVPALVYHLAALVMVSYKEDATGLFQIADRYLNIAEKGGSE